MAMKDAVLITDAPIEIMEAKAISETTCPICGRPLAFQRSRFESDKGSTDVYSVLDGLCTTAYDNETKKPCPNFAGQDLSNPKKISKTIRNLQKD